MFELSHLQGKYHLIDHIDDDVIVAVEITRAYGRDGIDEFQCTYKVFTWNRSHRDDIEIITDSEWDQRVTDIIAYEGEEAANEWIDSRKADSPVMCFDKYTLQAWETAQANIKKFKALLGLGVFTIPINLG